MWLSPPLRGGSHVPVVPKAPFCGYHCLNGGGGYGTPLSQPLDRSLVGAMGSGMGWDPQAVCWKTPGDAERCFPIHLTLPEAPWAQRGKLRQGREHSEACPQHQIQALSIPKSLLVLCSSEQTHPLCSHLGFLIATRQNHGISPSFHLITLHGILAEGTWLLLWAGRDGLNPSGKFLPSKCAKPPGK